VGQTVGRALIAAAVAFAAASCTTVAADRPEANASLQYLPTLKGDYFPLRSSETGTNYHIYIRYPARYASEPAKRYPIVYSLDGDSAIPLLAPEHLFIHYDDGLPEAIIVGIAYGSFNNQRHFDFSPRSGKSNEGGAPAFERFLRDHVIPAVEKRTRVDPKRRILVGQSRGGGFVFYSAFVDPDLFWARIASSPTLTPGCEIYFAAPAPARRNDLEGGTHAADLPNVYRQAMNWFFNQRAP
jgi:hypothetical protein